MSAAFPSFMSQLCVIEAEAVSCVEGMRQAICLSSAKGIGTTYDTDGIGRLQTR